MLQVYEDYFFSRGLFVADPAAVGGERHPAAALMALARFAEIRVTSHPELADLRMVEVAERNLGCDVPEPFMRGFPESARSLSPDLALFDQLVHYLRTYGFGDFSEAGHSLFEKGYERVAFAENVVPRPFAIVLPDEAEGLLAQTADGFLASTRPLNDTSYELLVQYLRDHGLPRRRCACKDTVCRLLIDLRDPALVDMLALSDVIRLVEWLLELRYPEMTLRKLNLKNQDRKLLEAVLDRLFERSDLDAAACLEKRRAWNGLLHHIHYRPKCYRAEVFCRAIRGREVRSAYSGFERRMADGDVRGATDELLASKGPTAVLRNLVYLLSRCKSEEDERHVLSAAETGNKIALIQLLIFFHAYDPARPRFFKFVHLNRMRKHAETPQEALARRSSLNENVVRRVSGLLRADLASACRGTLGKVYADEDLRRIALPLQEAASMGGPGTLPRGSRLPVAPGKKLRAFVYWEKVDDIDLSCFGIDEAGNVQEFSWRTMAGLQSDGIAYSGDQTSGYHGGSEYFDIDPLPFCRLYPDARYVVFCANVFTEGARFGDCVCRAGYMLRDEEDSGEVFEPKTVRSAFTVNCASAAAYLFAFDLVENAFVWLNVVEESGRRVAGEGGLAFLLDYMHVTEAMNLHDLACLLATEAVDAPEKADVVFSDADLSLRDGQEQIRSWDTARILGLLNA